MAVNYDIWGRPETWVDGTTAEQQADIKYPAAAKDTFKEQYTSGGIPYNEIDETLAFWGIGKDCVFCNPQYIAPYCVGGDINTIDVYQEPIKQTKTEQAAIFSNGDLTSVSVSYSRRWSYYTAAEIEADTQHHIPVGNGYTQQLYAAMNYQKIMVIPYVETVADTYTTGSYTTSSLYDYIENQGYNTKQRIVGIGYRVRYGEGIDENRTGESSGTSLLFSFDVPGKDVAYNSKQFYAHDIGMSFLSWSDGSGNCRVPMAINTARISGNATIGTADTGFRAKYCPTNDGNSVPWYFYDPDNSLWKINKTTAPGSGSTVFWYTYPYIGVNSTNATDVKNYVLKQIAYLGLPFVYDPDDAVRGQIGDIGVYLPVFDDNGITTGDYKEGTDALRLPNSEWVDGRESGYDPNVRPTPENHDTGDIPNVGNYLRRFGNHLKVWCLYQNDVNTIVAAINDLYQSSADPVTEWQTDFQGVNPSDYIVGLYAILIDPPKTDTTSTFTLGAVDFDGDISAYRYNFTSDKSGYFSFGTVDVPYYGDFRDYSPYTELELYIPLCGTVELDPAYFIGHKIAVDMYYDIYTMSCVAAVSRISQLGKTLYKTVNGTIGAQIPIMSRDMGDYQNTIKALESAHKQNENRLMTSLITAGVSAGIAIGTGGAALPAMAGMGLGGLGLINTLEQGKLIDYQLDHTQPAIAQTGVAETQNAFCVGQLKPKLNIKRATELPLNDTIYSQTVGNACCINALVGDRTGLIVCSDIKCDGIPATLEEINLIKQAFASGVYV